LRKLGRLYAKIGTSQSERGGGEWEGQNLEGERSVSYHEEQGGQNKRRESWFMSIAIQGKKELTIRSSRSKKGLRNGEGFVQGIWWGSNNGSLGRVVHFGCQKKGKSKVGRRRWQKGWKYGG